MAYHAGTWSVYFDGTAHGLGGSASNDVDVKSMFSLRGKLGYAFGNSMVFADAGWAWARSRYSAALSSNGGYAKAADQLKQQSHAHQVAITLNAVASSKTGLLGDTSSPSWGTC